MTDKFERLNGRIDRLEQRVELLEGDVDTLITVEDKPDDDEYGLEDYEITVIEAAYNARARHPEIGDTQAFVAGFKAAFLDQ